jgi:hypothetical protein
LLLSVTTPLMAPVVAVTVCAAAGTTTASTRAHTATPAGTIHDRERREHDEQ